MTPPVLDWGVTIGQRFGPATLGELVSRVDRVDKLVILFLAISRNYIVTSSLSPKLDRRERFRVNSTLLTEPVVVKDSFILLSYNRSLFSLKELRS